MIFFSISRKMDEDDPVEEFTKLLLYSDNKTIDDYIESGKFKSKQKQAFQIKYHSDFSKLNDRVLPRERKGTEYVNKYQPQMESETLCTVIHYI
jgi:hypothetical protein